MNSIQFHKYQGTGNDFVLIDNRDNHFDTNDTKRVVQLCDRRFGIGADGLILINNHPGYDFEMIYFNSDGSQSLCGNGSRCGLHFAKYLKIIDNKATFLAYDGPHEGFFKDDLIHLKMNDMKIASKVNQDYFLNTGSPHYVRFVDDVQNTNVYAEGAAIRNSDPYKNEGTNVNFAKLEGNNTISVRTYERGVENETLSCGTGVTAVSLAAVQQGGVSSPVNINVQGGKLQVSFDIEENGFTNVYLIGPAVRVFEGLIQI